MRVLVLCVALAIWMSAAAPAPAAAAAPRYHPIVPSDRTFKADQVEHLGYVPRLVFFGGSRAMRFEPKYAQAKTGLKGYNASFIGSTPEDVWAFVHFLHARVPGHHPARVLGDPGQHLLRQEEPGPGAAAGQAPGALHPLVLAQDAAQVPAGLEGRAALQLDAEEEVPARRHRGVEQLRPAGAAGVHAGRVAQEVHRQPSASTRATAAAPATPRRPRSTSSGPSPISPSYTATCCSCSCPSIPRCWR